MPLVRDDKQNTVTDFVAGIHRPFRRGQKVTFEISIQHQRKQFVVRPKEVWLEIVPMARPGQPTPEAYVFYDAHYVPNTTVPLLRWTVSDWPTDAVQAKIRFWCREDVSKPTASILLQSVSDAVKDPDFTIEAIPGVNSRIRIKQTGIPQISVVERHSAESNGVGTLKVRLNSNGIPTRVRHRFDAANRIATHFFEFATDFGSIIHDGEVQLTTRADALQGAWRIPDSTVVDVVESGDVHN